MNKRQAKKVIYAYLIAKLMDADAQFYITGESNENDKDVERLQTAVEEILSELDRRSEGKSK